MKPDKPSSKERILHVINAIHLIQEYTYNYSYNDFVSDYKTFDACMYQFTIIGEATSNIITTILDKYDYPWSKVKSFRNFILHEYHAVEDIVIWNTIKDILPDLEKLMIQILEKEF